MNVNTDGEIDLANVKYVATGLAAEKGKWLQRGDVLFNNTNSPELVGKTAYYGRNEQLAFSNHMTRITVRDDALDPRYLAHVLHANWRAGDFLARCNQHVSQASISREALLATKIPLPPLAEQRRIADKLDALARQIQVARERIARVPVTVRNLRKAVFGAAVDGGLVPGHSERTLARRGWKTMRAGDVCAKVQNGGTPKKGFVDKPGVPFLKVYNIVEQRVDFQYKPQYVSLESHAGPLAKSHTHPGDVLMNIVGPPLGKVAIVPSTFPVWNINQALTLFRPSDQITSEWLYVVLCSGRNVAVVDPETRGIAGQSNISLTQCRDFEFPVPPVEEQRAICERVFALSVMIDRLVGRNAKAAQALDVLVRSVPDRAFAGELCERESSLASKAGLAYESGERLLARIKNQPAAFRRRQAVENATTEVPISRAFIMKKLNEIGKSHLFDILAKAKKGITPEALLALSELDVDDFYTQLKREVDARRVKEVRTNKRSVLLEAVR